MVAGTILTWTPHTTTFPPDKGISYICIMAKRNIRKALPIYREDQSKCMSWCLNNGIKIHMQLGEETYGSKYQRKAVYVSEPFPDGLVELWVNERGRPIRSPKRYTQDEANMKIWELYCHYYDKENKSPTV